MYCPKCNTEYIEKIDTCADCHVALVPALLEEEPLEEKYWVKLHEFPSKTHAEMAGEILRKKRAAFLHEIELAFFRTSNIRSYSSGQ